MRQRLFITAVFAVILLTSLRCTLKIGPPLVLVTVKSDLGAVKTGRSARSPALSGLSCFGVVVAGAPNAVGTSQIGSREPACLKLEGAFFGPYTYDEIAGNGVQISLPQGAYQFSLVGYYRATGCGSSLSEFYSSPGDAVETYPVSTPITIDLAATTSASLPSSGYSTSTSNLTPACPPSAFSCTGSIACDTFTDTQNSPLFTHAMDSGLGWSGTNMQTPAIDGNRARIVRAVPSIYGQIVTDIMTNESRIRAKVILGSADDSVEVGLIARYTNSTNFMLGGIFRDNLAQTCALRLVEVIMGVVSVKSSSPLAYNSSKCSPSLPLSLSLEVRGPTFTLTYSNVSINTNSALSGTSVGVGTHYVGGFISEQYVDDFYVEP